MLPSVHLFSEVFLLWQLGDGLAGHGGAHAAHGAHPAHVANLTHSSN